MYFPTAMIECSPFLPFSAALVISLVCSLGGISGGFLLLPFQVSVLGFTGVGVSATNHLFNLIACPSGVYRFWREGRLIFGLAFALALGTMPGVIIGAIIRSRYLQDVSNFKLFVGLTLAYIGLRSLLSLRGKQQNSKAKGVSKCEILKSSLVELQVLFNGQIFCIKTLPLVLISLVIGVIGGIYGIGGGAIMSPLLVSLFGLPVYIIAGSTLFSTFLASAVGVVSFSFLAINQNAQFAPDWQLGLILGCGGLVGMYLGAMLQKYIPNTILKLLLTMIILGTAIRYLWQWFV